MTIPISPGPFSFLAEAGAAAGAYARAKEERKRHAEEVAAAGIHTLMQDILNGTKPAELLDDPNVRKMSKLAYGFEMPMGIIPQTKEIIARQQATALEGGGASGRAVSGIPSEPVAQADESVKKLAGANAQSALDAGVPAAQANTAKAVAGSQAAGANLNQQIFGKAGQLMNADPEFARLAAETAAGVTEARLRMLEGRRANLSLERQKLVDEARALQDMNNDIATRFDKDSQLYARQMQSDLIFGGKNPDNPNDVAEYMRNNPPPKEDESAASYLKVRGLTPQQFQRSYQTVMPQLFGKGGIAPTATKRATGAAPQTQAQLIVGKLPQADPAKAAAWLRAKIAAGDISDIGAAYILGQLHDNAPGDWYKEFSAQYQLSGATQDLTR